MAPIKYWLWLTDRKGISAPTALRLLDHFLTPERIYYADREEYELVPGLTPFQVASLEDKTLDGAERILEACQRLGIRIMTIRDGDYPDRLRQIPDPPVVLYLRGRSISFDEEAAVAVVGTRTPSEYGRRVAGKLGLEIARGGGLLVSGIAQGLDAAALKGALKGGGAVVSVLGGGIDVLYPYENRFLFEDVAAAGVLISEYPPGTRPLGEHFPVRNRIISGLSLGVVAVESRMTGGTMLTAERALEQNRDLFAVPGAVDSPLSEGTNALIQQGAKLVTCGRDILVEYERLYPARLMGNLPLSPEEESQRLEEDTIHGPEPPTSLPDQKPSAPEKERIPFDSQKERFTDDQLALLRAMADRCCSAEQLVELTQIPARRVQSALTLLQVDGAVEEKPGRRFEAAVVLE